MAGGAAPYESEPGGAGVSVIQGCFDVAPLETSGTPRNHADEETVGETTHVTTRIATRIVEAGRRPCPSTRMLPLRGKHGTQALPFARVRWPSAAPPCFARMMTCRRLRLGPGTQPRRINRSSTGFGAKACSSRHSKTNRTAASQFGVFFPRTSPHGFSAHKRLPLSERSRVFERSHRHTICTAWSN